VLIGWLGWFGGQPLADSERFLAGDNPAGVFRILGLNAGHGPLVGGASVVAVNNELRHGSTL
jgi:hypothetical protein